MTTKVTTFSLRLPLSLMAAVEKLAEADGTSMNQFLVMAAAEKLTALRTADACRGRTTTSGRRVGGAGNWGSTEIGAVVGDALKSRVCGNPAQVPPDVLWRSALTPSDQSSMTGRSEDLLVGQRGQLA